MRIGKKAAAWAAALIVLAGALVYFNLPLDPAPSPAPAPALPFVWPPTPAEPLPFPPSVPPCIPASAMAAALCCAEGLTAPFRAASASSVFICASVREAAALIGISRGKVYGLIRDGEIPVIHIGQRMAIPRQAVLD